MSPTNPSSPDPLSPEDLATLREIERRVLWLAVRMVDHANRREGGEVKVGGHQASCASMVSIMTALWFAHIGGEDKVAVKPHASPLYHAIKYLTGELDGSYLTTLRERGGLQAYPSRTKDPDVADFSTGSVGLGAVAPLFSAATRRFVDAHFDTQGPARFIATVGDAELDEGNVWEAIADPATQGLANVTLVVDLNRQSLDRVVPDIQAHRLQSFFADAGWHVVEAKYGHKLQAAFEQPGGDALRERIDEMPNEAYQSLFAMKPKKMRKKFLKGGSLALQEWAATVDDDTLAELVFNLGGHDLGLLVERFRECDAVTDRPSVVFAYTIKGWSLPMAGDPLNHAALLTEEQIDDFRRELGLTLETEWDRFPTDSAAGRWCGDVGGEINNEPPKPRPILHVPAGVARFGDRASVSSQEAFGRILTGFADVPDVRPRLVTTSPDVSISTNLGGIINKLGVFSPDERDDHGGADRLLRWAPSPDGHHIELGISEMNLFLLLGQLGLAHEHHGEMLVPIGTVYDPFVLRGLDAFIYSLYNAGRFIVAGTPSGVTLAPEGGAHQSTITASVGMELPGVCFSEPAYATELDWILCDAVRQLHEPDGESAYVRLSTRPVDQSAFSAARDRIGVDELRRQVLAGGYRLREGDADLTDGVVIATSGAMVPEALAAADELEAEGVAATIIAISSADRLYRDWQRQVRSVVDDLAHVPGAGHLDSLIKTAERGRPIISVQDAASHSLAWLGSAIGARQIALGVDRFGESGRIADLHDIVGISAAHIVNAGVVAAEGL